MGHALCGEYRQEAECVVHYNGHTAASSRGLRRRNSRAHRDGIDVIQTKAGSMVLTRPRMCPVQYGLGYATCPVVVVLRA